MNESTEPLAPLTDARVRELSNLARCGPDVVVVKKKRKYYPKSLSRGKAWATSEAGLQRFLDLVSPEPNTGCWLWAGCVGTGGYGHCTIDGYHARAHIASYLIFRGGIPDGLVLDHLCRVRSCVNPDHLEAVTFAENVRRGVQNTAPALAASALSRRSRTHCKNGHEFSPENIRMVQPDKWKKNPTRRCLACERIVGARCYRARISRTLEVAL